MNYTSSRWNKQPESTTTALYSTPSYFKTVNSQTSTGRFKSNPNVEYAGFWLRFWAYAIDLFLMAMLLAIPLMFDASFRDWLFENQIVADVAIGFFSWLYFAGMESSVSQGTIGKLALGLKVTDTDGEQLSFLRATGRHFGKILSYIPFNLGYVMAGMTDRRQALHDMISGCLVVREIR